jgi:hypothetical protein
MEYLIVLLNGFKISKNHIKIYKTPTNQKSKTFVQTFLNGKKKCRLLSKISIGWPRVEKFWKIEGL